MEMRAELLGRELRSRGLALLDISEDLIEPDVLVVYLHTNAGQWQDGTAGRMIRALPDIVSVTPSEQSPAILRVRVSRDRRSRGGLHRSDRWVDWVEHGHPRRRSQRRH
ncbi:hypothetical protein KIH74_24550 [Kineosporia sp. J2-2]|uniref:Uncharacterized protein n=1 Tax=Kineosporia corallincola TaxID=2835133 RepID=A0ABS5TM10_9ACTN|nr:hypothetical protein [Kineosporia corallincola]MBT0772137.1 hypothetical protein [Kineosporia corallincola]